MDTSKDAPVEAWSEERDALIVHALTGRLVVASQQADFQGLYFTAAHGD